MKYVIQVLERKLKELKEGEVSSRRLLRRKRKLGDFIYDKVKAWQIEDREKAKAIKSAIKILSDHNNT